MGAGGPPRPRADRAQAAVGVLCWPRSFSRVVSQEKNILHNGNISMDDVIEIARIMSDRSCARDLSGTIREILGTCVSVGCTVDHEEPRDLQEKVCPVP